MNALNQLPEGKRICIPCQYNGGRTATVRATLGHPEIIHIAIDTDEHRPYQSIADGYLHIDRQRIDEWLAKDPAEPYGGHRHQDALDAIEMIKGINKYYFAGTLTVLSCSTEIARKDISGAMYDVVLPMASAHLGGSWQDYYQDNLWVAEAETIKGSAIYLA